MKEVKQACARRLLIHDFFWRHVQCLTVQALIGIIPLLFPCSYDSIGVILAAWGKDDPSWNRWTKIDASGCVNAFPRLQSYKGEIFTGEVTLSCLGFWKHADAWCRQGFKGFRCWLEGSHTQIVLPSCNSTWVVVCHDAMEGSMSSSCKSGWHVHFSCNFIMVHSFHISHRASRDLCCPSHLHWFLLIDLPLLPVSDELIRRTLLLRSSPCHDSNHNASCSTHPAVDTQLHLPWSGESSSPCLPNAHSLHPSLTCLAGAPSAFHLVGCWSLMPTALLPALPQCTLARHPPWRGLLPMASNAPTHPVPWVGHDSLSSNSALCNDVTPITAHFPASVSFFVDCMTQPYPAHAPATKTHLDDASHVSDIHFCADVEHLGHSHTAAPPIHLHPELHTDLSSSGTDIICTNQLHIVWAWSIRMGFCIGWWYTKKTKGRTKKDLAQRKLHCCSWCWWRALGAGMSMKKAILAFVPSQTQCICINYQSNISSSPFLLTSTIAYVALMPMPILFLPSFPTGSQLMVQSPLQG